ncbi:MAG: hypothetical protein AAGI69_05790 [Cyanobacteria bacterium P01_H01_bin.21]
MSHYLQTIVAKNMGDLSMVRPRLVSRFETPADTVSLMPQLLSIETEAETPERGPAIASEPDLQQPQSQMVRLAEQTPSKPLSQPSQPPQSPVTPSISPSLSPTISDDLSESSVRFRPLSEPLSSPAPTHLSETDVSTSGSVVEPLTETSLPQSRAVRQPVPPHATPSLVSPQASALSRQPTVRPALVVSQTVTDDSSAKPLGVPEFSSSPRPLARSSSPPSSETSGPTIQVTIGRIDVRAITPKSSPPQAPKPRSAKPSLQDYLKTRNSARHGA